MQNSARDDAAIAATVQLRAATRRVDAAVDIPTQRVAVATATPQNLREAVGRARRWAQPLEDFPEVAPDEAWPTVAPATTQPARRARPWLIATGVVAVLAVAALLTRGGEAEPAKAAAAPPAATATPTAAPAPPPVAVDPAAPATSRVTPERRAPVTTPRATRTTRPPVATSTRPVPVPTADPQPAGYASCSEAEDAGAAPLVVGDPGYNAELDGDGDGIACE